MVLPRKRLYWGTTTCVVCRHPVHSWRRQSTPLDIRLRAPAGVKVGSRREKNFRHISCAVNWRETCVPPLQFFNFSAKTHCKSFLPSQPRSRKKKFPSPGHKFRPGQYFFYSYPPAVTCFWEGQGRHQEGLSIPTTCPFFVDVVHCGLKLIAAKQSWSTLSAGNIVPVRAVIF